MGRGSIFLVCMVVSATLVAGGPATAAGTCAGPASGGDWPVSGQNVASTRFQEQEHTIGPDNVGQLAPAWVLPAAGTFQATPLVSDGCVYIATGNGNVYALNADDGSLVWHAELGSATTLSIANGRVFVQSGTTITALDAATGTTTWSRNIAQRPGLGGGGSPLAFESYVVAGLNGCGDAGGAANCAGYYAILDQATGEIVVDGYDTSDEDLARGMRGAGFWSQPSYDPEDRYVYFGTANSRSINPENPTSNALLKIDADPTRATFGRIVGYFREELNPISNYPGIYELCRANPVVGVHLLCTDDDDWPATAVIYRDSTGRKLIGSTHSAPGLPVRTWFSFAVPRGNYFAIDPTTMSEVWRSPTSGARAAISAYDGERIYHSSGYDGAFLAVDKDSGAIIWQATTFGANNWQHVSVANGVVYTLSGHTPTGIGGPGPGLLLAFDARDGSPLVQRPMGPDIGDVATGTVAAGVTIARNTVFAPMNGATSGYLVAYRLAT